MVLEVVTGLGEYGFGILQIRCLRLCLDHFLCFNPTM
jgi:hypothetical protein